MENSQAIYEKNIEEVYMEIFKELEEILVELLDIEGRKITPETYLIKELGAESIDLLELAVAINSRFKINVNDDEIFLTRFRLYINEAKQEGQDVISRLSKKYPFLTEERIAEIISRITEGPQLKIKDLISYIKFHLRGREHSV